MFISDVVMTISDLTRSLRVPDLTRSDGSRTVTIDRATGSGLVLYSPTCYIVVGTRLGTYCPISSCRIHNYNAIFGCTRGRLALLCYSFGSHCNYNKYGIFRIH